MTNALQAASAFARAWTEGRKAARAMWSRTRDKARRGQNEVLLEADRARLRDWRTWLKKALRRPEIVRHRTPFCGAWQLTFRVHNSAPAVQKVVVEQQAPDGRWIDLAGRHTIEFRAWAARPRARIVREFSVPVDEPSRPLRIAVRGVGRVAVSHAFLTDGVTTRRVRTYRRKRLLGQPAPRRGFPTPDWATNAVACILTWERQ